jgi:hypothetical protein
MGDEIRKTLGPAADPALVDANVLPFRGPEFSPRGWANVDFPLFSKVEVNGERAHPLYKLLKKEKGGLRRDAIKWTFTKFLVDSELDVVETAVLRLQRRTGSPETSRCNWHDKS